MILLGTCPWNKLLKPNAKNIVEFTKQNLQENLYELLDPNTSEQLSHKPLLLFLPCHNHLIHRHFKQKRIKD